MLSSLKSEFPEVSISKIRFLESEGLLAPERAPSGYRRYAEDDIERLRYILSVQRDQYLPLRVIREHLQLMDAGHRPPAVVARPDSAGAQSQQNPALPPNGALPNGVPPNRVGAAPTPVTVSGGSAGAGTDGPGSGTAQRTNPPGPAGTVVPGGRPVPPAEPVRRPPIRLSRADLLKASGLSEPALAELERIQVIQPRRGSHHYGREALALAVAAKRLAVYGIDSRHLRAFKMAADREIGLVEQAIAPHVRRAKGSSDVAAEVTQLIISVHAALVRIGMDR